MDGDHDAFRELFGRYLVWSLQCPRNDAEHLMAAHLAVALLFVAGLGAAHRVVERTRNR